MKKILIAAVLAGFMMAATCVSAAELRSPEVIVTQTLPTIDLEGLIPADEPGLLDLRGEVGEINSRTPATESFTGNNQAAYDILREQIEQVAAGERDSATFEVTLAIWVCLPMKSLRANLAFRMFSIGMKRQEPTSATTQS